MRLPNGITLMHGKMPYDPVKAHEYYVRTRQLKGRRVGQTRLPTRKSPLIGDTSSPTYTVKLDDGTSSIVTAKQLAEQKAFAAKRVKEIKGKLSELTDVLKIAMRNAREAQAKADKAEKENAKPDTAAEKSEAARESKQYRDKHKTETATKARTSSNKKESKSTDSNTASTNRVAELETNITQIKDTLRAAVANQRALAGATRNR